MVLLLDSFRNFAKYLAVFLTAVIITSLFWNLTQFLSFRDVSYTEDYDYIVYLDTAKTVIVKNGVTGRIAFTGWNFSQIMSYLLRDDGLKIFIKKADYNISSNILWKNLKGVKIISDGARLNLNGNHLIIRGDFWENSQHNSIEGLTVINGSIILENSFMTSIQSCTFMDAEEGIVLLNTNSWTECTKIEDCYFENIRRSIVFKTPSGNGTSSYANTEIKRCYFKLVRENSVGIHVEPFSDFNEGLIQNVRIWMGEASEFSQTGILVEGSMLNTVIQNVIFESFARSPQNVYGIALGPNCDPPLFGQGLVFCGNLTSGIHNPNGKWLYGSGGSFKLENITISLGLNNVYGTFQEVGSVPYLYLALGSLNVKVKVEGNFSEEEIVYVRFKFKFIDGSFSKQLEISFNETGTLWLSQDDWLDIWPSRTIISSLVVDAKTTASASSATVTVSVYGQYT